MCYVSVFSIFIKQELPKMIKQILLIALMALVVNLSLSPSALAADKLSKEAKHAAKVKAGIAKLGTGKDAKIKVKLKDGTKIKGYVSQISEDSFTVTDPETGTTTEVPYPNAKQVRGNNLSSGQIAMIGTLVFILVLVALAGGD